MTKAAGAPRTAASMTTHPPWLWPNSPIGSGAPAARMASKAAVASAACSAMPASRQSPVEPPTPRLSNDAAAMPASSSRARIWGK
jgi:hypothetical protein